MDAICLLLQHGIDISIKDKDGRTALAIIENEIEKSKPDPASTNATRWREALESARDLRETGSKRHPFAKGSQQVSNDQREIADYRED